MPVSLKEHLESLTVHPDFGWGIPQGALPYKRKQHFIYFMESEDGYIKIGCSQNIKSRLRAVQGNNHMKIKLIGRIKGGYEIELKLHERFKKYKKRGEWFHPAPELIEYIAANKMYRRKFFG